MAYVSKPRPSPHSIVTIGTSATLRFLSRRTPPDFRSGINGWATPLPPEPLPFGARETPLTMETSFLSSAKLGVLSLVLLWPLAAVEFSCPATTAVNEKLDEPAGWKSRPVARQTAFLRVSVLNGIPGSKEYDLAPSSSVPGKGGTVTQVWKLAEYRDMNLFLRCHYHDTESVLTQDLPKNLQTCTFQFKLDAKGNFIGRSQLSCR